MSSERKQFLTALRSRFPTPLSDVSAMKDSAELGPEVGVVLSVMVRGEVTLRTLETWRRLLRQVSPGIGIHDSFRDDATHVIVDALCDETKFKAWASLSEVPPKERVLIVTPQWIISSLQYKSFQDCSPYVHDLQREGKRTKSTDVVALTAPPINVAPSLTVSPFACQRSSIQSLEHGLNSHLTAPLESLLEHYELQHDDFRAKAYKRALGKLKYLDFRVTDVNQVTSDICLLDILWKIS